MKTILVPTDFSNCARETLRLALSIGMKSSSHMYFLHILSTDYPNETEARVKLSKMVTMAEKLGLQANSVLSYAKGPNEIIDHINEYEIDLIVMGSHRVEGIKELFLGSVAQYVVRESPVPVLVVKRVLEHLSIRKIAFPSTFKADMTESLHKVIDLSKLWNAQISLLFINKTPDLIEEAEAQKKMKTIIENFPGVDFVTGIIETNDEEWAISEFLRQYTSDIVAISKHEYEGSFKLFSKNISRSLVNHENVPVLVV